MGALICTVFSSQKETAQKISSKITGRLSTYTLIGLAAGQEYTVSITGEKDGMMGTESTAEFTTCESVLAGYGIVRIGSRVFCRFLVCF